ncbi:MAG: DUF1565 domain-containing protein [Phycisphaerae bacterium]|nr:DUF1565 domain-containing protein [Phycisphaerae bacterium]
MKRDKGLLGKYCFVLFIIFTVCTSQGSVYFVTPDGNDGNNGSIDHPFKTIPKAVERTVAGDIINLRGGTYDCSSTISISKSGDENNLITLQNYKDETVILDFTNQPDEKNNKGIALGGSYWHLKGFTIQYAGDAGLNVLGAHNILERLVTRKNANVGLRLSAGSSYNLVLNCDSYLNYDAAKNGEDADGFGARGSTNCTTCLGPGNVFRGCRAWGNSDDGYDLWWANNSVRLEDCWAFGNGENIWNDTAFRGDGNGFKLGQGGGEHIVIRCIAYKHQHNGFDLNRSKTDATGVAVYNCIGVDNPDDNFKFSNPTTGAIHKLRNNISYSGRQAIGTLIDNSYNSWNSGFTVSAADFESLDPNGIDGPRGSDGSLPKLKFLHLAKTSLLIDAGTNVGQPFNGKAPDLGAFEN